jgi:multiple sugar transport system ATP-binding protein
MIQIEAWLRGDEAVLDGGDDIVPVGCLEETLPDDHPLLLGLWPDDLEISTSAKDGYRRATIYAVEFRGIDKAIQIDTGHHALRKVVGLDLVADQGDAIWYRLPPEQVFLFDAKTGQRLRRKPII